MGLYLILHGAGPLLNEIPERGHVLMNHCLPVLGHEGQLGAWPANKDSQMCVVRHANEDGQVQRDGQNNWSQTCDTTATGAVCSQV